MHQQVIIIGGGPSGTLLALILARANIDVLVLEKKPKEYHQDEARDTYKQQTSNNEYIPIANGLDKQLNQDSYRNAETNELKEIIAGTKKSKY